MSNHHTVLSATAFLVWIIFSTAACSAAEIVTSWKVVDDELSLTGKVLTSPFEDYWTNSMTLRRLVAERKTSAILELARQPQADLAKLASYFALRKVDLKTAQDLGLEIALTTSVISDPFVITVIEAIVKDLPNRNFRTALTKAICSTPIHHPSIATFLIQQLPERVLREWFEDSDRSPSPLTYEALVVERLYLEANKRKEAPTAQMKDAIEQYALVPGVPRMVFIGAADDTHPLFKRALDLFLKDERVPDDMFTDFLYAFSKVIHKNIDIENLDVSEKRRAVLRDALAKVKQFDLPRR